MLPSPALGTCLVNPLNMEASLFLREEYFPISKFPQFFCSTSLCDPILSFHVSHLSTPFFTLECTTPSLFSNLLVATSETGSLPIFILPQKTYCLRAQSLILFRTVKLQCQMYTLHILFQGSKTKTITKLGLICRAKSKDHFAKEGTSHWPLQFQSLRNTIHVKHTAHTRKLYH